MSKENWEIFYGTLCISLSTFSIRFVAVPRVFEKMHQQLESAFAEAKGPKAQLLNWATNTSYDHYNQLLAGGSGSGLQYRMAEKLLLRKIWQKLGLDRYGVI